MIPELNLEKVRQIVEMALEEDVGTGDITSQRVIPPQLDCTAAITAKRDGVIAGLPVAKIVFHTVDKRLKIEEEVSEGDYVKAGTVIMSISGWARSILCAERVALNLLGHLSGVATLTKEFVDKVKKYNVTILDTRKTLPGLRFLKKYAVCVGGGSSHRMGLYDQVLIKDTHLKIQNGLGAGFIHRALTQSRKDPNEKIEIEVQSLEEAQEAVSSGADILMLDNMSLDDIHEAVERFHGKVILEVSGGVSLSNVEDIAKTGIDYISVGALTHSPPQLDLSLKIV